MCPVGADLFHADVQAARQAGMIIVAFRNFPKAPKELQENEIYSYVYRPKVIQ